MDCVCWYISGCDLIAEGLAANKMLTSLDLSNNKIRDMGAIALAEALHNNKTLKELKLSNNRIGTPNCSVHKCMIFSCAGVHKHAMHMLNAVYMIVMHELLHATTTWLLCWVHCWCQWPGLFAD